MPKQIWDSKILWLVVLAIFTIIVVFSAYPVGFFTTQTTIGKSYIYANGQRVATIDETGALTYSHADYLGSARLSTSEQREQAAKYDNAPFGSTITETGYSSSLSPYKFTGKEQDSSGLYYYGARYYNPDIGRFVSVDPIYNPTESPYAYARNNPVKYVDPSGGAAINVIGLNSRLMSLYKNTVQSVDELREMSINDYVDILGSVLGWNYNEPGGKNIFIGVQNENVRNVRYPYEIYPDPNMAIEGIENIKFDYAIYFGTNIIVSNEPAENAATLLSTIAKTFAEVYRMETGGRKSGKYHTAIGPVTKTPGEIAEIVIEKWKKIHAEAEKNAKKAEETAKKKKSVIEQLKRMGSMGTWPDSSSVPSVAIETNPEKRCSIDPFACG